MERTRPKNTARFLAWECKLFYCTFNAKMFKLQIIQDMQLNLSKMVLLFPDIYFFSCSLINLALVVASFLGSLQQEKNNEMFLLYTYILYASWSKYRIFVLLPSNEDSFGRVTCHCVVFVELCVNLLAFFIVDFFTYLGWNCTIITHFISLSSHTFWTVLHKNKHKISWAC